MARPVRPTKYPAKDCILIIPNILFFPDPIRFKVNHPINPIKRINIIILSY